MTASTECFHEVEAEWNLEKLYRDLSSAKAKLLQRNKKELTSTEKLYLKGLLSGYNPAEIAKKRFIQPQGLNVTLSNTLYRYVEELTGHESNSIDNWRQVAEWLETAGYKSYTNVDWGEAPDIPTFCGRESELYQLKQWLLGDRARLVGLFGMGGIGKTALAVTLVEQIKDQFEYVVWRSLRDAPTLDALISDLPCRCSNPTQPLQTIPQLLKQLENQRCLIVLDDYETLLCDRPVGHHHPDHENYGDLLQRLGPARHKSCILLLSREKPKEFNRLEGKRNLVFSLPINRLSDGATALLRNQDIIAEDDKLQKLIQLYGGIPLALKLVSTTIHEIFEGNVTDFLKQDTTFMDSELIEILGQQFERLSPPEADVLRQMAIAPQPQSLSTLRQTLSRLHPKADSIQTIEALYHRSLLEKVKSANDLLFTLHPIVLKGVRRVYLTKD